MPLSTSTAVLCRLFARFEGGGELIASVPGGMSDLAYRLTGDGQFVAKRIGRESRLVFGVRDDAKKFVRSLLCLGSGALARDRYALEEMLNRVALSGVGTRPLEVEEFEFLQAEIGHGNWCNGIGLLGERREQRND